MALSGLANRKACPHRLDRSVRGRPREGRLPKSFIDLWKDVVVRL